MTSLIQSTCCGQGAYSTFTTCKTIQVVGVTSGGVFLLGDASQAVFLTPAPYHSPITINLQDPPMLNEIVSHGDKATWQDGVLSLSSLSISIPPDVLWNPLPPTKAEVSQEETFNRSQQVVRAAANAKGGEGMSACVEDLYSGNLEIARTYDDPICEKVILVEKALAKKDIPGLVTLTEKMLGYGRGLTPAADDFWAGILLVFHRWVKDYFSKKDLHRLTNEVYNLASRKTTSISTTLIHWAGRGQADERSLAVLDGLFSTRGVDHDDLDALVRMGHSSGVDTLVGIATALKAMMN